MAAGRRKSTRSSSKKSGDSSASVSASIETPAKGLEESKEENPHPGGDGATSEDDSTCPACKQDEPKSADADKESWIRCDACTKWFHWRCVSETSTAAEPEALDKWFCKPCLEADPKRTITVRPPARKSSRQKKPQDYANLHSGADGGSGSRWLQLMQNKTIAKDNYKRMQGSEVGIEWLESDDTALKEPIVIEQPDGLGMKMPSTHFTVEDVAEAVGEDTPVEVIDVTTQSNCPSWTLRKWADYYNTEPSARDKIRNVISLEISGTTLADQVLPPRLVRELDWVEKYWPSTKKGRGHAYPKVQLYCLMGVADAWTDWHIDFAGSSVYYHILSGAKVFYFIRPTPANLTAYERWSGTELQNHAWLGDMVDEVVKVELTAGNTMIIPTGWIHAVYTPMDTLVFGGNFLHSYGISTQLKICEIEKSTHVPKKFRFPHFVKLCWYVAEKYVRDLKAKEEFHPRVMESIEALASFLVTEARTMERGSEQAKKVAKEHVPGDRIKDPAALARELRWRIRLACGYASDEEGHARRKHKPTVAAVAELVVNGTTNGVSQKRKREPNGAEGAEPPPRPLFKNFKPKKWDVDEETLDAPETSSAKAPRPGDDDAWKGRWREWTDEWELNSSLALEEANVRRRREVMVRVRKTGSGLERQRIERVVEEWAWPDVEAAPSLPLEEARMSVDGQTGGMETDPSVHAPDEVKVEGGDEMVTEP